MQIHQLSQNHSAYPLLLKETASPPKRLYVRGNIDVLSWDCIAIVGSRKPTSYGKRAVAYIGDAIAATGIPIVSGLAYGIDALAHKAAIAQDVPTIAVLGGGVDDRSFYPKANLGMAREILNKGGAIISEFKPGTSPLPAYFPQRNRIIAGLSCATVIIEAGERSGAHSTAHHALNENRDVFAVPGSIFSPLSKGTNSLIQKGANVATSGQEILETLSFVYQPTQISLFTEERFRVREALKTGPKTIQALSDTLKLPHSKLLGLLTQLELDGQIQRLSGQLYAIHE